MVKVEKILKGSLDSISSPSVKIQIMGAGKFARGKKAKHCWVLLTNFLYSKFVEFIQQCFAMN